MGTHALDLREWLVVDDDAPSQLDLKRRLVAGARDVVVATTPVADDAANEVRDLVVEAIQHSGTQRGDGPLVDAALMVQEDLVLLQRIGTKWTVTAGVVCFPTHWTIGEKLGRPVADVHASVAHYDSELRERVDRFTDRLTVDRPVWRRNWFVSPTDLLHLPSYPQGIAVPEAVPPDGAGMWIRSERQTLRRLARSDAILFTIRVQLAPLGVLRQRPDLAERMLAAVSSWDAAKRSYTSTGRILTALERWLSELTGAR